MPISEINTSLTIDYLKSNKENLYFDRKSARIEIKSLANIVSSFANANGGLIVLGIENDGLITGFKGIGYDKLNELQKVFTLAYLKNIPNHHIEIVNVKNNNNENDKLLLFHVELSSNKVIRTSRDEVYLRQGDSSNKLTAEQIRLLEYDRNEAVFEDELSRRATLEDIDEDIINLYREKLKTDKNTRDLLKARKFLISEKGKECLTNAGVLLFTQDPSLFLPSARVRIIKIEGTEMQTGTEMNVVKDVTFALPLYKVIMESKKFIETQLREFNHLGPDGKFIKVPEYPEFAWMEGLVNAVTHRDYSIGGEHIKIVLYDDRLEIISPGKL